jgi:lysophospholipase L1-like esterase
VPLATTQANVRAIVAKVRAIGAVPVLVTVPPDSTSSKLATVTLNAWLRRYAAAQGLHLLDFYGQAVDPATGNYLASFQSSDGRHPGGAGLVLLGQYVANTLVPLLPLASPPIVQDAADTANRLTNGLLLGAAAGNGVAPALGGPP